MRLARAGCGGVNYWMELPLAELMKYLLELVEQVTQEREAAEEAERGR
jgi:hypothetical protein